jgi:hypothetical protein
VIGVTSFAAASEDAFVAALLSANGDALCIPPHYKWEHISIGGRAGAAWPGCAANGTAPTFTAFAFADGRAYLFTAYAPVNGNLFQETRELMGRFMTTIRLAN